MLGRVFLGRYETIRLLGEGGMGRVYLARQLDLSRDVVVKVMHEHIAADAKFRDRFRRETELMARLAALGAKVREVEVSHLPRTAGEQSGANLRVVARAFKELFTLYGDLKAEQKKR